MTKPMSRTTGRMSQLASLLPEGPRLSRRETARLLGVIERHLRTLHERGEIHYEREGELGHRLYSLLDVLALADQRRQAGTKDS